MGKQKLTHSRMQAFKLCRTKAKWAYQHGIRPEQDARALRMGSAGHEGLDCLKKTGSVEQAMLAVQKYYEVCPDETDPWDWAIESTTIQCLVNAYAWRWQDDQLKVIASEQSFSLPLVNPETNKATPLWELAGKVDGIIEDDGRTMLLEHKFIGEDISPDSDYWRRLTIDSQISIYTYAARQLGHPVSSVMYDVIRKPTVKPEKVPELDSEGLKVVLDEKGERVLKKDGTPRQTGLTERGWEVQSRMMTPEEWAIKLLADIGKRPEFYFQRQEIARLDDDIATTLAEIWELQKTYRECEKHDAWYKTVNMGSCTYCPYFGLCSSNYQYDGENCPEGFVKLEDVHPELGV